MFKVLVVHNFKKCYCFMRKILFSVPNFILFKFKINFIFISLLERKKEGKILICSIQNLNVKMLKQFIFNKFFGQILIYIKENIMVFIVPKFYNKCEQLCIPNFILLHEKLFLLIWRMLIESNKLYVNMFTITARIWEIVMQSVNVWGGK